MPDFNPNDLQQWLEALKREAEARTRGTVPPPPPTPSRPSVPSWEEEFPFLGKPETPQRKIQKAEEERRREAEERERLARETEEREEEKLRKKRLAEERKRKKQEIEKTRKKGTAEAKPSLEAKPSVPSSRPTPSRSTLALSQNLIHDLRTRPEALREAVLLLEILGPPLCDRDPFERWF